MQHLKVICYFIIGFIELMVWGIGVAKYVINFIDTAVNPLYFPFSMVFFFLSRATNFEFRSSKF